MVLLSAQGMDVAQIADVAFTSPDGSEKSWTTSTTTGSTRWRPSMRAVDHRSSTARAKRDQEEGGVVPTG